MKQLKIEFKKVKIMNYLDASIPGLKFQKKKSIPKRKK